MEKYNFFRENEIFDDFQPLCKMAILSHPLIYTKWFGNL